ncbi:MAG: TRAP transporter small permease subunit [Elusimicrobia bacterium]|nr:TRAP transporter small permease subunit [Elusimicrobiota bacterium]
MGLLRTAERGLAAFEQALLSAMLLAMVALSFSQVVLRGFSAGILWADTFLRHLVLWLGFLGAALAAVDDKQFAMDAAFRLMSRRTRAAVQGVLHVLTAGVSALMAKASWTFFQQEREASAVLFSVGDRLVPAWWFETILPAGFALLCLHYLLKAALAADPHAVKEGV